MTAPDATSLRALVMSAEGLALRTDALAVMFAEPPRDWWRFVPCRTCNALRQTECQAIDGPARGPHVARRRSAESLHGTLWLLARFPSDVIGGQP